MKFQDLDLFLVGGATRDEFLARRDGLPVPKPHDLDFTVIGVRSLEELHSVLLDERFKIHKVDEKHMVVRAGVPEHLQHLFPVKDADFVPGREEGGYTDGRHAGWTKVTTSLHKDLDRRDFTCNAIARSVRTGEIVDPHNGIADIDRNVLRFVGDPMERIQEDAIRIMRAFRFMITKKLNPTDATYRALVSAEAVQMLANAHIEMIFEELRKMFKHDSAATMFALCFAMNKNGDLEDAIFRDGLRLDACLKA